MFENPRRGRQSKNFTTKVPKDPRSQIVFRTNISRKLTLGAPDIMRLSFTQYNNSQYRIYWAWYFSLATKKPSNMWTRKMASSHKIEKGASRWGQRLQKIKILEWKRGFQRFHSGGQMFRQVTSSCIFPMQLFKVYKYMLWPWNLVASCEIVWLPNSV